MNFIKYILFSLIIISNTCFGKEFDKLFVVYEPIQNSAEIEKSINSAFNTMIYRLSGTSSPSTVWKIINSGNSRKDFIKSYSIKTSENKNYLEVSWVNPWISLAYFIGGFKIFLMASASLADRTDLFIKTGLLTISANLFLNFFLIKEYGVLGAVSSTIISYIILIFLLFIYSRGLNNIIWPNSLLNATIFHIIFHNFE